MDTFLNLSVTAGVQTEQDQTPASTPHYIDSSRIRFRYGVPEKIGGWQSLTLNSGQSINGICRSIFSYNLNNTTRYLLGTQTRQYYLIGSSSTNITPLESLINPIPNSLDSNYIALPNNSLSTITGQSVITVLNPNTKVRVGDTILISGSVSFNGVPSTEINTTHFVREQDANSFTFDVLTPATSSGLGGGASVILATSIVTVNQVSSNYNDGDRIELSGAVSFAGISDISLNQEHIIRNTTAGTYDIVVDNIATSSVLNGGGGLTSVRIQIESGLKDGTSSQGYGAGLYGTGLYGVARTSNLGERPARTWTFDRFGNLVLSSAGDQTSLYAWNSDIQIAPTLVANAPIEINYFFVSNEIITTLGASNTGNRIQWSDQGNLTEWVSEATNQAGQDDIEEASTFLSHIKVKGVNLLFTQSQVFTFRYVGRPLIWETKLLDGQSGIISKNARVQYKGMAYWMGSDNFYLYRSGNVEVIKSNSTYETTLKNRIFNNINPSQVSKIFAWFNKEFNEVWWHIPTGSSLEPDIIVRYNVLDATWVIDDFVRSAGEYPVKLRSFPYLAQPIDNGTTQCETVIQLHENGVDEGDNPMPFRLISNLQGGDASLVSVNGLVPDSIQTGSINVNIDGFQYPQISQKYNITSFDVAPDTGYLSFKTKARYIQYTISGSELGQFWRAGQWKIAITKGGRN